MRSRCTAGRRSATRAEKRPRRTFTAQPRDGVHPPVRALARDLEHDLRPPRAHAPAHGEAAPRGHPRGRPQRQQRGDLHLQPRRADPRAVGQLRDRAQRARVLRLQRCGPGAVGARRRVRQRGEAAAGRDLDRDRRPAERAAAARRAAGELRELREVQRAVGRVQRDRARRRRERELRRERRRPFADLRQLGEERAARALASRRRRGGPRCAGTSRSGRRRSGSSARPPTAARPGR